MNPKRCILLVDDDEVILEIGMMMLEKLGHMVLGAKSGAEALSIYKEHGTIINLVLLDLNMPGERGAETFKKIREIDPDAKVILSTGAGETQEVLELKNLGCLGMIRKPFSIEDLSNTLALLNPY
jgi:DNA-binding NtrC family response regulator